MPVFLLDNNLSFPPVHLAEPEGELAIGGDLSPQRLLLAYQKGIFPWFSEGDPIIWWSPDPRMVLFPENLKVSKSMRSVFNQRKFEVTFDRDFAGVIRACQTEYRPGQSGTWITDEMMDAYFELHKLGFAHSVEVWKDGRMVGGLYGISLGNLFFGESMFSKESNASKTGFIVLVKSLAAIGFEMIDCQIYTDHLDSLGAILISRSEFSTILEAGMGKNTLKGSWENLLPLVWPEKSS